MCDVETVPPRVQVAQGDRLSIQVSAQCKKQCSLDGKPAVVDALGATVLGEATWTEIPFARYYTTVNLRMDEEGHAHVSVSFQCGEKKELVHVSIPVLVLPLNRDAVAKAYGDKAPEKTVEPDETVREVIAPPAR